MASKNCDFTSDKFINYGCFSSNNQETHAHFCEQLIIIKKPIYYIPIQILGASLLCVWRNQATSCLGIVARRVTCGIALGTLAIIGIIDTVARLGLAFFKSFQGSKTEANEYLKGASMGFQHSLYYITGMEVYNLYKKSLQPLMLIN
jgi:hypothetical protein